MEKNSIVLEIKKLAESGDLKGGSMTEVFAKCYNAVRKTLSITPFDEQLAAAAALYNGNMVQMQTGEGKTLAAVFASCAQAVEGRKVHIFTFNDYLADRDAKWMSPVYKEMGISLGCIRADTPKELRKEIYGRQVVYTTAKEAGFDYLRDFVTLDPDSTVFPEKPDCVIVDEADSIMIDEARIPLVIAGDIEVNDSGETAEVYKKVLSFNEDDYGIDDEGRNIFLTDSGADKADEIFGVNIYDLENSALLDRICSCIKARVLLNENKDYIVKDGRIILIDEFTGRAAEGRVFPGELQSAVESKHNLKITSRGRIMGNIALQFFIRLYQKISGMTGTASAASEEFSKLYGLKTVIIPTRLPCIRIDHPLELYFDKEEKIRAVISAVKEAYSVRRPVLVGTESIEESENLAELLMKEGISAAVLNAKNDFEEAEIISNAGKSGTVTISTNMAGRGVDIKLGGDNFEEKEAVKSVGGLLVLAASMRESSRITMQLRGRSGRQGDPGESRFFASLDDEIMIKYNLKSLAGGRHYPSKKISGALEDKTLLKEAERIQRISEGRTFDDRMDLLRYSTIGEKHRDITFERRKGLLDGSAPSDLWQKNAPELYKNAAGKYGEKALGDKQDLILAALLNEFWCDYLDYTAYLREGIHLTQIAGRSPAEEYNIACEEYYDSAAESIPERMTEKLSELLNCEKLEDYKIKEPSRVYTYLLNDQGEEFKKKPILLNIFEDDEDTEEKNNVITEDEKETEKKGFFSSIFGKKKKR